MGPILQPRLPYIINGKWGYNYTIAPLPIHNVAEYMGGGAIPIAPGGSNLVLSSAGMQARPIIGYMYVHLPVIKREPPGGVRYQGPGYTASHTLSVSDSESLSHSLTHSHSASP